MIKKIPALAIILMVLACGKQKTPAQVTGEYFDLKGYFTKEAVRLSKAYKSIHKTVSINSVAESKTVPITSWAEELKAFTEADINKASWKGLFNKEITPQQELFTSANEKVQVKKLLVEKKGARITHIAVIIKRVNLVYTSIDSLDYFPDSIYSIRKAQNIKLLSEKRYSVLGKFN